MRTTLPDEAEICLESCRQCQRLCLETAMDHCLAAGGRWAEVGHVRTMFDCAQMCGVTAEFLMRHSDHYGYVCGLCSHLCKVCAESCELTGHDDETMRACATACHRCGELCLQASKQAALMPG
jgi:hypothetical protein